MNSLKVDTNLGFFFFLLFHDIKHYAMHIVGTLYFLTELEKAQALAKGISKCMFEEN